ncbi:predicted protein [Histoplasma capsulatum var. duboisii H88]|uniref:Predicted protein n=1 Tax=Ajellomyces capsulatus (strain H88) TaxID=544711 RepID=F0UUR2_AJEC8|nr:predicted protein [Histoplasma capsulatum var. duboisii H88]
MRLTVVGGKSFKLPVSIFLGLLVAVVAVTAATPAAAGIAASDLDFVLPILPLPSTYPCSDTLRDTLEWENDESCCFCPAQRQFLIPNPNPAPSINPLDRVLIREHLDLDSLPNPPSLASRLTRSLSGPSARIWCANQCWDFVGAQPLVSLVPSSPGHYPQQSPDKPDSSFNDCSQSLLPPTWESYACPCDSAGSHHGLSSHHLSLALPPAISSRVT